jgi:pimeloyl-ACP methyl ester carboxylesterase
MDFADFDKNFDKTAHAVLALCQADATCSAKLGPDPLAKAMEALAAVDAGQCPIAGAGSIRAVFGQFMGLQYYERLLLPASIYRILRCSAADYDWLSRVSTYAKGFWGTFYPAAEHDSQAVFNNIVFSELWPNNPTSAELLAQEQTMIAFWGWPPSWAGLASSWPKYPHDAYYGNWPSSPAPILVLQGTLDPRTPYGSVVKIHYSGPNQYYVELPKANHGTAWIEAAPTADPSDQYGCGWQVIQSFLADPTKAPDTSCIAGMAPLDWGNPPAWWLARVGITDLWENP